MSCELLHCVTPAFDIRSNIRQVMRKVVATEISGITS